MLKAAPLSEEVQRSLLDLAGPGTTLHRRHGLYLDFVAPGIPFLPRPPQFHPVEDFEAPLAHLRIEALDVVDTVVSKLKRFSANDLDDIRAMVERGLVAPDRLKERFLSAMDGFSMDARAEHLPAYIQNLHQVERDLLLVEESRIDLPPWLDEED